MPCRWGSGTGKECSSEIIYICMFLFLQESQQFPELDIIHQEWKVEHKVSTQTRKIRVVIFVIQMHINLFIKLFIRTRFWILHSSKMDPKNLYII